MNLIKNVSLYYSKISLLNQKMVYQTLIPMSLCGFFIFFKNLSFINCAQRVIIKKKKTVFIRFVKFAIHNSQFIIIFTTFETH